MGPQEYAEALEQVRLGMAALSTAAAEDLPASMAADAAVVLQRVLSRGEAVLASVERRVETSGLWAADGARSATAWLARHTGASRGEVGARLTAARQCEARPAFAQGFAAGDIRVRHLTLLAAALDGPGEARRVRRERFGEVAEAFAQVAAAATPARFARELARWCERVDPLAAVESDLSAWRDRRLVFTELGDTVLFEGSLPLAEGRLLQRRCEALARAQARASTGADTNTEADTGAEANTGRGGGSEGAAAAATTPRAARLVDALCALVEAAAAAGGVPMLDGVPAQVIVVVPAPDLGTVTAGLGSGSGPPGSTGPGRRRQGPVLLGNGHRPAPVSREQARRWACGDAEVRRLVTDADGVITELGRSRRVASRDQRRYLLLRDGGCRFAGCGMPADRCQPHHLTHWADGGGTDVATMACLCTHCHHLVHEGGFTLTGDPETELITRRPDGTEIGRTTPIPAPTQLAV